MDVIDQGGLVLLMMFKCPSMGLPVNSVKCCVIPSGQIFDDFGWQSREGTSFVLFLLEIACAGPYVEVAICILLPEIGEQLCTFDEGGHGSISWLWRLHHN